MANQTTDPGGTASSPAEPIRGSRFRNRALLLAGGLALAFLLGFVPQYLRSTGLESELATANWQLELARVRDLSSRMFVDVSRNNFGTASQHASEFFTAAQSAAPKAKDLTQRAALEEFASRRAAVMDRLAKTDPDARNQLQSLMAEVHERLPR